MKSKWWIVGLCIALMVAVLAPLASKLPDGLERVAQDHNFAGKAAEPAFSVMPDYAFPGIDNETAATIIAGIIGTLLLFGIVFCLAGILRSKHEA